MGVNNESGFTRSYLYFADNNVKLAINVDGILTHSDDNSYDDFNKYWRVRIA